MAKYKIKTMNDNSEPIVEAITFDELVKHGLENGANVNNGMPWSWNYKGHPITHENDQCYLISPYDNNRMTPNDMLVTDDNGEIYVVEKNLFELTNEKIEA